MELTSEQHLYHSAGKAHLNIHVKIVSVQYSFHFLSIFISKSNMGHESMCMHKEYQPYDFLSECGGGGERGLIALGKNSKGEERALLFLKASKSSFFI